MNNWLKFTQLELHSCIYKTQIHIVHIFLQINSWLGLSNPDHNEFYSANAGWMKREQYGSPSRPVTAPSKR